MTDREFVLWLLGLLDAPGSAGREAAVLETIRNRLQAVRPAVPARCRSRDCEAPHEELPTSCPRGASSGVLDNEVAAPE